VRQTKFPDLMARGIVGFAAPWPLARVSTSCRPPETHATFRYAVNAGCRGNGSAAVHTQRPGERHARMDQSYGNGRLAVMPCSAWRRDRAELSYNRASRAAFPRLATV